MSGGWQGSNRKARLPSGWAKIRARILERDPICVLCGVRPSAFCDHIVAKADRHGDDDLQGVCGPCHDQKSAREGAAAAKAAGRPSRRRSPEQHPGLR
ncbi:HNH endonuclease signature motif containing protein [Streptomyces sp. KN37]|uniref:HNH endonuclease signature motif containing protein n=1 Tax=Streptomyces sp. KN37 TaxID=3090667 RepID=UPI002A756E5E|nr:HNH endonuclease signature motif containing protein [Streptomyces sp. KN37]WPO70211.1 HNH endonuclease signature motif containing protein [Streptomyces sp. KN37]